MDYESLRKVLPTSNENTGTVTIKGICDNNIRRIPILQTPTYNELCFMMHRLFRPHLSTNLDNLVLYYRDEDGDQVLITDDMDVSHALTFSSVLRITVNDKETLPPPSSRTDLPAVLKNLSLSAKSVSSLREKLSDIKKSIDGIIEALPNEDADHGTSSSSGETINKVKPLSTADMAELLDSNHNRTSKPSTPVEATATNTAPLQPTTQTMPHQQLPNQTYSQPSYSQPPPYPASLPPSTGMPPSASYYQGQPTQQPQSPQGAPGLNLNRQPSVGAGFAAGGGQPPHMSSPYPPQPHAHTAPPPQSFPPYAPPRPDMVPQTGHPQHGHLQQPLTPQYQGPLTPYSQPTSTPSQQQLSYTMNTPPAMSYASGPSPRDFNDYVQVTPEVLSLEKTVSIVHNVSAGAIATFSGITRNTFQDKKVIRLEYEGYVPMAENELRKLIAEARAKWHGLTRIAVRHRIGVVPVGETSVIVAVSSVHREASLEAARMLIDRLKETVPIWKKEIYEDGSMWKENSLADRKSC